MKQIIFGGLALAVVALSAIVVLRSVDPNPKAEETSKKTSTQKLDALTDPRTIPVDVEKSQIIWTGRAVGKEHVGTVDVKSGEFGFDENKLVGAILTIDMQTITDNDLSGAMQEKLVTHLKSDDFFGVEKYPEAYLVVTRIEDAAEAGYIKGYADLTIKGIKQPVTIYGKTSIENGRAKFEGDMTIDRTLWDVKFGSEKFIEGTGVQIISDEITFRIVLVSEEM